MTVLARFILHLLRFAARMRIICSAMNSETPFGKEKSLVHRQQLYLISIFKMTYLDHTADNDGVRLAMQLGRSLA